MSLFLASCNGANRQNFSSQNPNYYQVFDWIRDYARDYCVIPPTESSVVEVSVGISKDTGFFGLLEKIGIGLGPTVEASFKRTNGVLQQHLAPVMISTNYCLTEVMGIAARLIGPVYVKGGEINALAGRKYIDDVVNPPLQKMYREDAEQHLIYWIPKIPGGLTCEEFTEMLHKTYKEDRVDVIEVAAQYLHTPLPRTCYNKLLAMVYTEDVPAVAKIVN